MATGLCQNIELFWLSVYSDQYMISDVFSKSLLEIDTCENSENEKMDIMGM